MLIDAFITAPTTNEHQSYKRSFFRIGQAPEYATGEVIMSSLYREVGYRGLSERKVPSQGNAFFKRVEDPIKALLRRPNKISARAWHVIIDQILKSPKQPNQSKKRFLQINPIVPETALYTSAARLRGNPWNPGGLVKVILSYGFSSPEEASHLWQNIFNKLSVTEEDDVWAQFLDRELKDWRPPGITYDWTIKPYEHKVSLPDDVYSLNYPAKRFVKDLDRVLAIKDKLNRRQWISLLESILRIGVTSHVMWICHVHEVIWAALKNALQGNVPSKSVLSDQVSAPREGFWMHGSKIESLIREKARNYYTSRIGINLLLRTLEDKDCPVDQASFNSIESTIHFLNLVAKNAGVIESEKLHDIHRQIIEKDPRQLACSKGIPSNIFEFLSYSLRQRQTSEEELRNYDQGYYLRKKNAYSAAPWIVSIGPVSVLALAHCCTSMSMTPKTIVDFCEHLSHYGISVQANDVPENELGGTLRNLGLVVDSPDAEGGMVIIPPFQSI